MSIQSPQTRLQPIVVRMTPEMGRGVFAARSIAAGEVLGEFHSVRIPAHEAAASQGSTLSTFWFEDEADGAVLLALGWIELINHSTAPNTDRSWRLLPEGDVVTVFALKPIAAGEQLFIDYRFDANAHNPSWA